MICFFYVLLFTFNYYTVIARKTNDYCISTHRNFSQDYFLFNTSSYLDYKPFNKLSRSSTLFNVEDKDKSIESFVKKLFLTDQKEIGILILGGSVTAGVNCEQENLSMKTCAWPYRFKHWLQSYFPEKVFNLQNKARGGTQTAAALGSITTLVKIRSILTDKLIYPDLIISDFSFNDMFEPGGVGGSAVTKEDKGNIGNDVMLGIQTEVLIRSIRTIVPNDVLHIGLLYIFFYNMYTNCNQLSSTMRIK